MRFAGYGVALFLALLFGALSAGFFVAAVVVDPTALTDDGIMTLRWFFACFSAMWLVCAAGSGLLAFVHYVLWRRAEHVRKNGLVAVATLTAVEEVGGDDDTNTVDLKLTLFVIVGEAPGYTTTVSESLDRDRRSTLAVGRVLDVRVDPKDPTYLWIDLTPQPSDGPKGAR